MHQLALVPVRAWANIFKREEARVKVIVCRRVFVCGVFRLIGTRKSTAFFNFAKFEK